MPEAARISDKHVCSKHRGGVVTQGFATVMIGFLPAARLGDACVCPRAKTEIKKGSATVFIGSQPAARKGDAAGHKGFIVSGFPTVNIGNTPQIQVLRAAVGSSRVDLQACKLEYSIVSPK